MELLSNGYKMGLKLNSVIMHCAMTIWEEMSNGLLKGIPGITDSLTILVGEAENHTNPILKW